MTGDEPARRRFAEPKFAECDVCRWVRSSLCRRCDAGEFFEERVRELSPDSDIRFRGPRNDD